jgi:RND superfamily putative drug exporter
MQITSRSRPPAEGSRRGDGSHSRLAARLGRWSVRHRLAAILIWLGLVVTGALAGAATGQVTPTQAQQGTGESARALRILQEAGVSPPAQETVLVRSTALSADQPAFRAAVADVIGSLRDAAAAASLGDPYRTGLVSRDRHAALVTFTVPGDPMTASDRVGPALDAVAAAEARHPGVTMSELGDASGMKAIYQVLNDDFRRAEWIAVPLALGILLVAFGALVAAVLPVTLAVTAVVAALGLLGVLSHLLPMDPTASSLVLLIGLAVGVDYCLFYLRRERQERARGHNPGTALQIAAATSGRSVLVSGATVMVAMGGLLLSGLLIFQAMALATVLVVLIAMVGSVTVLPATMSLLGDRVEGGRLPGRRRARRVPADMDPTRPGPDTGGRVWGPVLRVALHRPGLTIVLAVGLLLALAAPALGMRTQKLALGSLLGPDTELSRTYQQIQRDFPGGPEPAEVVLRTPDPTAPAVTAAVADLADRAVATGAAGRQPTLTTYREARVVVVEVPLAGSGDDRVSRQAVNTLRHDLVPATVGRIPGVQAAVGGNLAFAMDWDARLRLGTWLVVAAVLAITFLIMLVSFRSAVIALTAITLDLLSVAAAFGIVVAVFQRGHGTGLLHVFAAGAVEDWIPLFVFVILFGLSMDYHVFVLSRIREARLGGLPTRQAVQAGIVASAGTVTSAAAIMVAVFAVFATLSMQDFQQLGVGLAAAVLLDATVIRALLLPAVMAALGEHNWGRRGLAEPIGAQVDQDIAQSGSASLTAPSR